MGKWENKRLTECWLKKAEQDGDFSQKRLRQCCGMVEVKNMRLCKALPQRSNDVANLWQKAIRQTRDYAMPNLHS